MTVWQYSDNQLRQKVAKLLRHFHKKKKTYSSFPFPPYLEFKPFPLLISVHWNFFRLLLLSSIGLLSYRVANLLSLAITPPQLRSSILQLPRILSCRAIFDNFGSLLLFFRFRSVCTTCSCQTQSVCGLPQSLAIRSFGV